MYSTTKKPPFWEAFLMVPTEGLREFRKLDIKKIFGNFYSSKQKLTIAIKHKKSGGNKPTGFLTILKLKSQHRTNKIASKISKVENSTIIKALLPNVIVSCCVWGRRPIKTFSKLLSFFNLF